LWFLLGPPVAILAIVAFLVAAPPVPQKSAVHQHPNNFLSGVYYVRTHPGADTINFHDPRNQSGIIRPPVVELTAENIDQVVDLWNHRESERRVDVASRAKPDR
jgi:hypothetical protein